jgi:hypothetical protein
MTFKAPLLIGLILMLLVAVETGVTQPAPLTDPFVAVVVKVTQPVNILRTGVDKPGVLGLDQRLYPGDRIFCGEGGQVSLIFADTAVEIKVLPNTELTLQGQRATDSIIKRVMLHLGDMLTHVLRGDMEVITPTCVASVKGTQWWTRVDQATQSTSVVVLEGKVRVARQAEAEAEIVSAGNTAVVGASGAIQVNPSEPEDFPVSGKDEDQGSLDIEFQDGNGQPRTLHIEFDR